MSPFCFFLELSHYLQVSTVERKLNSKNVQRWKKVYQDMLIVSFIQLVLSGLRQSYLAKF